MRKDKQPSGQSSHFFKRLGCVLPLSVRGIARVSKLAAVFPDFRGLSLAAKAATDLRTLVPTIVTLGGRPSNTNCDWPLSE